MHQWCQGGKDGDGILVRHYRDHSPKHGIKNLRAPSIQSCHFLWTAEQRGPANVGRQYLGKKLALQLFSVPATVLLYKAPVNTHPSPYLDLKSGSSQGFRVPT